MKWLTCLLLGHAIVLGEDPPLGRARVFTCYCARCGGRKRYLYGDWLTADEFCKRAHHLFLAHQSGGRALGLTIDRDATVQ